MGPAFLQSGVFVLLGILFTIKEFNRINQRVNRARTKVATTKEDDNNKIAIKELDVKIRFGDVLNPNIQQNKYMQLQTAETS